MLNVDHEKLHGVGSSDAVLRFEALPERQAISLGYESSHCRDRMAGMEAHLTLMALILYTRLTTLSQRRGSYTVQTFRKHSDYYVEKRGQEILCYRSAIGYVLVRFQSH